jgi:acetate---CoA ligase (ADP-forming)
MTHKLDTLFRPASIAIVGASERNVYAAIAANNLSALGYQGEVYMVNQRGSEVFGRRGYTSCAEVGQPIDAAYIAVPLAGVLEAARDAIAAGARVCVVLTSDFAETDGEGIRLQDELTALCREHGVTLMGPNCLGYINYLDGVAMGSIPALVPQPGDPAVAIVSASGATSS